MTPLKRRSTEPYRLCACGEFLSSADLCFLSLKKLFFAPSVYQCMKWMSRLSVCLLGASLVCLFAAAQPPAAALNDAPPPPATANGPVVLDWTPPALAQLGALAAVKNSFTLDRNMLNIAAS